MNSQDRDKLDRIRAKVVNWEGLVQDDVLDLLDIFDRDLLDGQRVCAMCGKRKQDHFLVCLDKIQTVFEGD